MKHLLVILLTIIVLDSCSKSETTNNNNSNSLSAGIWVYDSTYHYDSGATSFDGAQAIQFTQNLLIACPAGSNCDSISLSLTSDSTYITQTDTNVLYTFSFPNSNHLIIIDKDLISGTLDERVYLHKQ